MYLSFLFDFASMRSTSWICNTLTTPNLRNCCNEYAFNVSDLQVIRTMEFSNVVAEQRLVGAVDVAVLPIKRVIEGVH